MEKEELKPIITFDKDVFIKLKHLLKVKDNKCVFCNKRVTKSNVGGFTKHKKEVRLFCKDTLCLIKHILEEKSNSGGEK